MKKTRKELMEEACKIADEHELKKKAISSILDELDNNKKFGQNHISGMATVEELMLEIEELEKKHSEIIEEIKKG